VPLQQGNFSRMPHTFFWFTRSHAMNSPRLPFSSGVGSAYILTLAPTYGVPAM
jgi:hypothetical protein